MFYSSDRPGTWEFFCICLLVAEITGMYHKTSQDYSCTRFCVRALFSCFFGMYRRNPWVVWLAIC